MSQSEKQNTMKNTLIFLLAFLPFVAFSQHAGRNEICDNVYETPATITSGDTVTMYFVSGANTRDAEDFVRSLIFLAIASLKEDGRDFELSHVSGASSDGTCKIWKVVFIKTND